MNKVVVILLLNPHQTDEQRNSGKGEERLLMSQVQCDSYFFYAHKPNISQQTSRLGSWSILEAQCESLGMGDSLPCQ